LYNIVCYGDSNTWGYMPDGTGRFDWQTRWPGVLQRTLGDHFKIVEEGLNGRTTCFDDPVQPHRNGLAYLPVTLLSHKPIDVLVIMLGTNDLKSVYNASPYNIAKGANALIQEAKRAEPHITHILLISPPVVLEIDDPDIKHGMQDSAQKSSELAQHYDHFAKIENVHFLDAANIIESSPVDGVHLDKDSHTNLGVAVANVLRNIFDY